MQIVGVDFTSSPGRQKPITAAICDAGGGRLTVNKIELLPNFPAFAALLSRPGPWVAGIDFPFGQSQELVEGLKWPNTWEAYVRHVAAGGKSRFCEEIARYQAGRPTGKKEHHRVVDKKAGSISPMKLYGVPVGKMFCTGAPLLLDSTCSVLPFRPDRDPLRVIVEAYPKLVVRKVVKTAYKTDIPKKATAEHGKTRQQIVDAICAASTADIPTRYGFRVKFVRDLAASCVIEENGDRLDAVLAALQAAWAWSQPDGCYGIPEYVDKLEGWIVDPELLT